MSVRVKPRNIQEDFASSAMMRLIAAGLARQDIAITVQQTFNAHVPLSLKRGVLEDVLAAHGPIAILSILDAAPFMPKDPVVQALIQASNTSDLLVRWSRLERFSHSRHKVHVEQAPGGLKLSHCARDGGPGPTFSESLLVLGLLAVLTELTGGQNITAWTEEGALVRSQGRWYPPDARSWRASMILPEVGKSAGRESHDAQETEDTPLRLRKCVAADPLRRWSLAEVANVLGLSSRTLQRRLEGQGVSFSELVANARLEVAASKLCKADGPSLAETGFLSGFSDQAHFSKAFKRVVGTSPGLFRENFATRAHSRH
jgi:AraC-like DNA-binding protein